VLVPPSRTWLISVGRPEPVVGHRVPRVPPGGGGVGRGWRSPGRRI